MFNDIILTPRASLNEARELLKKLARRGPVIGTDEAGRGALAGPVYAASVYLTPEQEEKLTAMKLRDSKKLSPKQREKIFQAMNDMGVLWVLHEGSIDRIETDNILQASLWTMKMSAQKLAKKLDKKPSCVVVDGTERIEGLKIPQWTLIEADNLVPVVSAASIVAKVLRDRFMTEISPKYPGYDFAKNKGYPTMQHINAVNELGLSDQHRPYFCKTVIRNNVRSVNIALD